MEHIFMRHTFYTALLAASLTAATGVYAAAAQKDKITQGGSKADACVSDVVTSMPFFKKHAGHKGPIDISDVKKKCEQKTGENIRFFTGNKFQYDFN
jgi:hypothetical protein